MEKLIELLNEYQKELNEKEGNNYEIFERKLNGDSIRMNDLDDPYEWLNMYWWYAKARLISKQFWFIKRLIQNDKIDLKGIEQRAMYYFDDESPVRWKEIRTERLIMMLSIQDNPIEDLIGFLK